MKHYQIFNKDCINFLASLKARTVDLILTDPPYNVGEFVRKKEMQTFIHIVRTTFKNQFGTLMTT